MSSSALRLVVPAPEMFAKPDEPYNPTVHHVTQEQALDASTELTGARFTLMGTLEMYSGHHPEHGKCIIMISGTSDSVIIPMT